jgi:hypothetical protein
MVNAMDETPEYSALHKRARHDVRMCIQAWSDILRSVLGNRIDYLVAKGSAVKAWESPIDYVPIVSDVDLHLNLKSGTIFSEADDPIAMALSISERYNTLFLEMEPKPLHIPRSQLILVSRLKENLLKDNGLFVEPRLKDVRVVIGQPSYSNKIKPDLIRKVDKSNLLKEEEYISWAPMGAIDRSGLDYWAMMRRMTWRIGPAPYRLLTQSHDDPMEVWSWNRTRLRNELQDRGHNDLATNYESFYFNGWKAFLSDFKSEEAMRSMILSGCRVLSGCINEIHKMG